MFDIDTLHIALDGLFVLLFLVSGFLVVFILVSKYFELKDVLPDAAYDTFELSSILNKRMIILKLIAKYAVYVGLLGTVLGIMLVFMGAAQSNEINPKFIMGELSLALKSTAFALIVSIPAAAGFDVYSKKITDILNYFDES